MFFVCTNTLTAARVVHREVLPPGRQMSHILYRIKKEVVQQVLLLLVDVTLNGKACHIIPLKAEFRLLKWVKQFVRP